MKTSEHDLVLAHLNLFAVLKNLEELVVRDPESARMTADWNETIQFTVMGGPQAFLSFSGGRCTVGRGAARKSTISLFFLSPRHLNRMFSEKANPIPVKGFLKLPFLAKKFPKLTERLEYFLKPTDALLKDPGYLALNTLFTLHTAAFAAAEMAAGEAFSRASTAGLGSGSVLLKVLPEGPAAHIEFDKGKITAKAGEAEKPAAFMYMKDLAVANAFLNQKMDAFAAIAKGEVAIWGQMPFLDALSRVLDRIPVYLAP